MNSALNFETGTDCCHRAGDTMKLPSSHGLDVTAVMSMVCEHEMFISSVCLSRGEKYGYAAAVLNSLKRKITEDTSINFYYDINCSFKKYWEVTRYLRYDSLMN